MALMSCSRLNSRSVFCHEPNRVKEFFQVGAKLLIGIPHVSSCIPTPRAAFSKSGRSQVYTISSVVPTTVILSGQDWGNSRFFSIVLLFQ